MSTTRNFILAGIAGVLLSACGGETPPPQAPQGASSKPLEATVPKNTAPAQQPSKTTSTSISEENSYVATGYVRVLDLGGEPMANMAPIVTRSANAFDPPLSTGALTDAEGRGSVRFPNNEKLFLRAWDPQLAYFPNNFFTILPASGDATDELTVVMAKAASLSVQLYDADNAPLAHQNIGIMMFHPTEGPWWPASANTDAEGLVHFPAVPPGSFVIKVKAESGLQYELPALSLAPGADIDVGAVILR